MKNPDRHTRPLIGETRQRFVGLRNFLILPRLFCMRNQPIQIYFWAAIINLVPSIANATNDAERIASMTTNVQSVYLTSFEKSLFTEASSRFKKYIIPNSIQSGGAFWLDNERLVMSSRKYLSWEAQPDEMSRVILYNVITGTISDSGYRGIVRCLNHLGDVLISQEEKESGISKTWASYKWLTGQWGHELTPIQPLHNAFVPSYLCRFASYGSLVKRAGPQGVEFFREITTPLLESHGFVEELQHTANNQIEAVARLIKPSGQKIPLQYRRLSHLELTYMPWRDSYFEASATPPEPISFSPDGVVEIHHLPKLLSIWDALIRASVAANPSKLGTIWVVQQGEGLWRKQGIFLQLNSDLMRIEEGQALGDLKSSPDGCRIHVRVYRGNPFKRIQTNFTTIVIDLCRENDQ